MKGFEKAESYFDRRGWKVFDFQAEVWGAFQAGESGLVHAPTGTGKSYAVWFAPLIEWLDRSCGPAAGAGSTTKEARKESLRGLSVLWITPLKALAADTMRQLAAPLEYLGIPWTIELRTGDTSASIKARQRHTLPDALITTPESLSLLLTHPGVETRLGSLLGVIVDEWHELIGTKRGVQTELALARLRKWNPGLRVWGLSATLGNLDEAMMALLGTNPSSPERIVRGLVPKHVIIDTLLPSDITRFPWGGHMGLAMLDQVLEQLEEVSSALIFTNTRSQTESWFRAILQQRPEWAGTVALHHGSLDRDTRRWVEENLSSGALRCVVCTSSLDLGVDFTPVERVFQIGSPKGIARLMQRAGRSGHQPDVASRVTGVPTNAFEVIEYAAARRGSEMQEIEHRTPVHKPLDLLVQHVVTVAAGTGFDRDDLYREVATTYAYRDLSREEWDWVIAFAECGGDSLKEYRDYRRIEPLQGRYHVSTNDVLRRHRMSIGTIVGDAQVQVRYRRGGSLGSVEESFISRLNPGDVFFFAGKALELIQVRDMKAYVRRARGSDGSIPRWMGGQMPLSTQLAAALRQVLTHRMPSPEMNTVEPILTLQSEWSTIPADTELLIERTQTREGHHLILYPFEGRLVHEGLAAVLALRISRLQPITFTLSFNDYGIELMSVEPAPLERALASDLFSSANLLDDIRASMNEAEMAKRQFREVARVAGLVFQGYPGRHKSAAAIQASSGLLFDVFNKYEPGNLLLVQARREVLERQLEERRLRFALERIREGRITVIDTPGISPFAFPIYVDRIGQRLTSEKLAERIRRMQLVYEQES